MLHVACVFVGHKYPPEYVHKLYTGVLRHMNGADWVFNVVTDQPELFSDYRVINVKDLAIPGYWNKICLFRPGSFPDGDRVLYFDLDVLITGPLGGLWTTQPEPFVIMRDPIHSDRFNSSVMMWEAGTPISRSIWTRWNEAERPYGARLKYTKGDQAWIEWVFRNPVDGEPQLPVLWNSELVKGYYRPSPDELKAWVTLTGPGSASVIVFHGAPRFHDKEMASWVKDIWYGL